MKTRSSHTHRLKRKKEVDYSNYYFAMALYDTYKKESRKDARLLAGDFRNGDSQKKPGAAGLKQKLGRFILAITTTIRRNAFIGKEKPLIMINRLCNTHAGHYLR